MPTEQLQGCQSSGFVGLERMRFFPRQLITPADLTQDQIYFRDKMRRHNRLLHGWGVVCGCDVVPATEQGKPKPWSVTVQAGYVLGPYGDEIVIDSPVTLDLRREGLDGNALGPCGQQLDPWCSEVEVARPVDEPLYLAVRYAECETRPVRAQPGGCGCNETQCEYSRIRDSYAFAVLTDLPASYSDPMPAADRQYYQPCSIQGSSKTPVTRPCLPCPAEPWVILADVVLRGDGTVKVDLIRHRRFVETFAGAYSLCRGQGRVYAADVLREEATPSVSGATQLIDVQAQERGEPLKATVALKRKDGGTAYLPAYFAVNPGETLGDLVTREGGREYQDPVSNDTFTLRELFAMTGADPRTPLTGTTAALAPLEGRTLDVAPVRQQISGLRDVLGARGIERLEQDHLGAPAAAPKLSATTLKGVAAGSTLSRKLSDKTVADVASMERDAFLNLAVEGVREARKAEVVRQAEEVWTRATRVARLTSSTPNQ